MHGVIISLGILGVVVLAADFGLQNVAAQTTSAEYCAKYGTEHTMCKYPGVNQGCSRLRSGVSRLNQNYLTVLHNKRRSRVAGGKETLGSPGNQPGAQDMKEVVYDLKLAEVAQRWADQCQFGNDANRTLDKYESVGQNVYSVVGDVSSLNDPNSNVNSVCENALTVWYSEVARFNRANVGNPPRFNTTTGRYAQMVQWNVEAIGCGYVLFTNANNRVIANCFCNYGIKKGTQSTKLYTATNASTSNVCALCTPGEGCEDNMCRAKNPCTTNPEDGGAVTTTPTQAPVTGFPSTGSTDIGSIGSTTASTSTSESPIGPS